MGYVYIIKMTDINNNNYYKIGATRSLNSRIKEISVYTPYRIALHSAYFTEECFVLEKELHDIFEDHRLNGEWFMLRDGDFERGLSSISEKLKSLRLTPLQIINAGSKRVGTDNGRAIFKFFH